MHMIKNRFLLKGALLAFALLAGCGGSSRTSGYTGGNPTIVTFTFSGAVPAVVASRIGSGGFTQATLSSNVLTLSIPAGTIYFAVAFLCPSYTFLGNTFQRQIVFEASVEDGTAFGQSCTTPPNVPTDQTGTLSGTVDASAIPDVNMVWLSGGNGSGTGFSGAVKNVSTQLPVGTTDVMALASENTYCGSTVGITVLAVKDLGEQTVPGVLNNGNPIVLTEADETTLQPISYKNAPSGGLVGTSVTFTTEEGGLVPLQSSTNTSYPAVPAAMLQGEAQYAALSVAGSVETSSVSYSEVWNNGGRPLTVVFPSAWTYPGPSAAALPVFDFSTYSAFTGTAGVTRVGRESWQTASGSKNTFQVTASAGFQGGADTVGMPDLSGLHGFLPVPPSGATVSWQASISKNNMGAIGATPVNSSTETVQSAGRFVVP
jgi:hypothetical protein